MPVAKPWLGKAEEEATQRVLRSGWITQGAEVAAFEREFAAFVGASHACAVSSCTAALVLALRVAEVGREDEVVTVSHSFIATANAVRLVGAVPIFVDIEAQPTYNIDAARVERLIGPRTKAILCVHQMGMPCDLDLLGPLARKHGLILIEDAACAVGSEVRGAKGWERIGLPHGDLACFSFHPRKILTTGDGGMITTARSDWDRRLRLLRQHGMSVADTTRHDAREVAFESYEFVGYNFRMTDLQAAVGRVQLQRVPEMVERRREQVRTYRELLKDVPGLVLPHEPDSARTNWQSFCVGLPDGVDQKGFMQRLLDGGIATRRAVMCAHREPAYAREPWSCEGGRTRCACEGGKCRRLARSEAAQDRGVILPLFHELPREQQEAVAAAVREACARPR